MERLDYETRKKGLLDKCAAVPTTLCISHVLETYVVFTDSNEVKQERDVELRAPRLSQINRYRGGRHPADG